MLNGNFLCLSCPSATFPLQHGDFVPREWLAAKGPLETMVAQCFFWAVGDGNGQNAWAWHGQRRKRSMFCCLLQSNYVYVQLWGVGALQCTQGISNNVIVVFSFHYEMTTKAKFISLRKREWQLSCLIVFFNFVTFHSELVSDFLNNVSSLRFHTPVPPALPASMLMLFDCLLWWRNQNCEKHKNYNILVIVWMMSVVRSLNIRFWPRPFLKWPNLKYNVGHMTHFD